MELKGALYAKKDTVVVSDKFSKRSFILKTSGQYPEHIEMQLVNDKCAILNDVAIGQEITCHINIKGRLWNSPDKGEVCYNTIDVWKVDK